MEYKENQIICKCKKVTVVDIENALHRNTSLNNVEKEFEEVQKITHCSTGCGGCHDKIMDMISKFISG
jgi:NAD(P)H-nitrite reductase large subunit